MTYPRCEYKDCGEGAVRMWLGYAPEPYRVLNLLLCQEHYEVMTKAQGRWVLENEAKKAEAKTG